MGIVKKIHKRVLIGTLLMVGFYHFCSAQKDTLRLSNEDLIVGEIKYLDKGVLFLKTVYSNVDIQVKWKEVNQISTSHIYLITLDNGERLKGRINSHSPDSLSIFVIDPSQRTLNHLEIDADNLFQIPKEKIVQLNEINESFASKFNGEISLGFNLARSNKLRQFSIRNSLTYMGDRWGGAINLNAIRSIQESTSAIKRYEGAGALYFYLPRDLFLVGMVGVLSNTQQLIDIRVNTVLGAGIYLIHTNHSYLNIQAGLNNNDEKFQGDLPPNSSLEAILGTDFNFYDVGKFNLSGALIGYKSFSEKGRYRSDSRVDATYHFYDDFFLKLGISMNFDNMSTEGATDFDYVVQSTVGWKF